jgi:hypothetical protein
MVSVPPDTPKIERAFEFGGSEITNPGGSWRANLSGGPCFNADRLS